MEKVLLTIGGTPVTALQLVIGCVALTLAVVLMLGLSLRKARHERLEDAAAARERQHAKTLSGLSHRRHLPNPL